MFILSLVSAYSPSRSSHQHCFQRRTVACMSALILSRTFFIYVRSVRVVYIVCTIRSSLWTAGYHLSLAPNIDVTRGCRLFILSCLRDGVWAWFRISPRRIRSSCTTETAAYIYFVSWYTQKKTVSLVGLEWKASTYYYIGLV